MLSTDRTFAIALRRPLPPPALDSDAAIPNWRAVPPLSATRSATHA